MLRTTRIRHSFPILAALALFASTPHASAYTETAIHSFCAASNCTDGDDPLAGLVGDAGGNFFYGTTQKGGKFNSGVVFKLVQNGSGYKEFIVHNFCSHTNCGDGGFPRGDLILDKDGNLYGTAPSGGAHNAGVVFRLRHGINGWGFAVLHNFCNQTNCADGSFPSTGLSYSGQIAGKAWNETSPLFGTTDNGGAHNRGTVFELVPNGSGGWSHSVLHSFNPAANSAQPGPVLVDHSDNLFGLTLLGGSVHGGLLYKLAANTWNETVLHNFCSQTNCADGSEGNGRLLLNGAGNLFGTTSLGGTGAQCTDSNGCGVVFERTQAGKFKVIYNFCSATKCKDGYNPAAGLIADSQGNLFGTTYKSHKGGTIYMLTHASSSWNETVLYNFCSLLNCTDGAGPVAPVIQDVGGNLFGTGSTGGAHGDHGVVYELTGLSGP